MEAVSLVTTATIVVSTLSFERSVITGHNFEERPERSQSFEPLDPEGGGGYKFMECDVYGAGFNYISGASVEEWFRSLPWKDGDAAFLVWDENGEKRGHVAMGWRDE